MPKYTVMFCYSVSGPDIEVVAPSRKKAIELAMAETESFEKPWGCDFDIDIDPYKVVVTSEDGTVKEFDY